MHDHLFILPQNHRISIFIDAFDVFDAGLGEQQRQGIPLRQVAEPQVGVESEALRETFAKKCPPLGVLRCFHRVSFGHRCQIIINKTLLLLIVDIQNFVYCLDQLPTQTSGRRRTSTDDWPHGAGAEANLANGMVVARQHA